jgi:hypothetical protein
MSSSSSCRRPLTVGACHDHRHGLQVGHELTQQRRRRWRLAVSCLARGRLLLLLLLPLLLLLLPLLLLLLLLPGCHDGADVASAGCCCAMPCCCEVRVHAVDCCRRQLARHAAPHLACCQVSHHVAPAVLQDRDGCQQVACVQGHGAGASCDSTRMQARPRLAGRAPHLQTGR